MADMSHTLPPNDKAFAQGLEKGDIVMCWNHEASDAVMRVHHGVEEWTPVYADKNGTLQRFRFALPLYEYIECKLLEKK